MSKHYIGILIFQNHIVTERPNWSKDTGSSQSVLAIRLNANGTLDNTFDSDGAVKVNVSNLEHGQTGSNASASSRDVDLQSDGRIVIGGQMKQSATKSVGFVLQLNADGSVDTTFGGNGVVSVDVAGTGTDLSAIAVEPDGDRPGMSLKQMADELLKGVEILSSEKGHDGLMRASRCGNSTGKINIYEIRQQDLSKAQKAGFTVIKKPKAAQE